MSRMFVIESLLERVWKEMCVQRYQWFARSEDNHVTPHTGHPEHEILEI
jgi:hypothetical protein